MTNTVVLWSSKRIETWEIWSCRQWVLHYYCVYKNVLMTEVVLILDYWRYVSAFPPYHLTIHKVKWRKFDSPPWWDISQICNRHWVPQRQNKLNAAHLRPFWCQHRKSSFRSCLDLKCDRVLVWKPCISRRPSSRLISCVRSKNQF